VYSFFNRNIYLKNNLLYTKYIYYKNNKFSLFFICLIQEKIYILDNFKKEKNIYIE